MTSIKILICACSLALLPWGSVWCKSSVFPQVMPNEKPDLPLSAAVKRNYDAYLAPRPEDNELLSLFKYTEMKGLDYNNGDGTITRRDPSKVILHDGKYYLYYQAFQIHPSTRGDDCPVAVSWAKVHDPEMKRHTYYYGPDFYYQHDLSKKQRERIAETNGNLGAKK